MKRHIFLVASLLLLGACGGLTPEYDPGCQLGPSALSSVPSSLASAQPYRNCDPAYRTSMGWYPYYPGHPMFSWMLYNQFYGYDAANTSFYTSADRASGIAKPAPAATGYTKSYDQPFKSSSGGGYRYTGGSGSFGGSSGYNSSSGGGFRSTGGSTGGFKSSSGGGFRAK